MAFAADFDEKDNCLPIEYYGELAAFVISFAQFRIDILLKHFIQAIVRDLQEYNSCGFF